MHLFTQFMNYIKILLLGGNMEEVRLEKNDELVMKLLHFFITEQG